MSKFTNKGKEVKMNQSNLKEQQETQRKAQEEMQAMQIESQVRDSARQSRNLGISYSIAIEKALIDSGMAYNQDFNETELREMIIDRAEYFQNYILRGREKEEA